MAFRLELAQELIAKFNGRKRAIQDRGGGGLCCHITIFTATLWCAVSLPAQKRCRPHKKYRPNNKDRRESVFMCNVCNETMCSDCFRLAHVEMLNQ